MPKTNLFDVIVVGTEPAALMAAGLLSRRKVRVMVVGQGAERDTYTHQGVTLSTYPSCVPAYGHSSLVDGLLRDLALEDPVHRLAGDQDTHLQVVTPDQRIDLFTDRAALAGELTRAMPDDRDAFLASITALEPPAAAMGRFLEGLPPLPPDGFRQRARLKRLERDLGATRLDRAHWPWLTRVLDQATCFTSHLSPDQRSDAATARQILSLLAGPRIIPDLESRLAQACEKSGAVTEMNTVAEHFTFEGRHLSGIQALRTLDTYRAETLIAGMPLSEAVELLPLDKRRQRAKLAADVHRPDQSVFIINLALPREALPRAMAQQVLLVRDPAKPLVEDNLIRLLRAPIAAEPDREQISLACLVPYRKHKLGREYLGPLHERLMEAAAWIIPFLEVTRISQSSPFWSARAGDSGHPSPWTIHRTLAPSEGLVSGLALLGQRTRLRKLLLCGAEVLPGLDLEGAVLTARRTVDHLADQGKLPRLS